MDTVIITKDNIKPIIIPYTDWYVQNAKHVIVVDEINEKRIVGRFNYDNIAGVYTTNDSRLKNYEDQGTAMKVKCINCSRLHKDARYDFVCGRCILTKHEANKFRTCSRFAERKKYERKTNE